MKKIVISEFMDEAAVETLRKSFDVTYDAKLVDDPGRLAAAVSDADALIVRNRTQVRGDLLAACAKASVIGRLGVGLDNIDVAACEARGMKVIPATGANALAVAEYVIGTAMVLLRGVYFSSEAVAAGKWPRAALSDGRETAGTCLGLVGFGGIGRLCARLARSLGMTVIAHDPMVAADSAGLVGNGRARRVARRTAGHGRRGQSSCAAHAGHEEPALGGAHRAHEAGRDRDQHGARRHRR